mgnify:CR=1 FL=1
MSLDENLRGTHPILEFRIRGLLSEPKLKRYGTYPATRLYSKQKYLYDGYKAGKRGFNLAANPDRILRTGRNFPYKWKPRGSWHQVQADGYSHAVDLRRPWNVTRAMADKAVRPFMEKWGLRQTVWPKEWWHVQALTSQGWIDGPQPSPGGEEMFMTHDPDNDEWIVHVAGVGSAAVNSPDHWREVIAKGRMTGVYESNSMNHLWAAMKKQSRK